MDKLDTKFRRDMLHMNSDILRKEKCSGLQNILNRIDMIL